MKRKILVPMFASVMALSINSVANADEVENKEESTSTVLDIAEYQDVTYKIAIVKDGVAVKIREQGSVQHIAYTGNEFKVLGTQGEWVKVAIKDGEGWIPERFVDIKESYGYTTLNKVNFRKEASLDSEIVEELEIGSTVEVLEDNGSWIKVKKGENEGYIRALYVSEEAPVIETEEEVIVRNTEIIQTVNNNNSNNNTSSSSNQNSSNKVNSNKNNVVQAEKPSQNQVQNSNDSYKPPVSNISITQAVVNLAYSKIGSPYVWGAEGPNSFDCSGLTSYVYRNVGGITLPRTSSAQARYGQTVSKSNLQPGDLVFFSTNGTGNISHVGIYIGGGSMIHSPKPGDTVRVTSINSSYYTSKFVIAKRVL